MWQKHTSSMLSIKISVLPLMGRDNISIVSHSPGWALGNANRTLDSVVYWVLLQCFQTNDDIVSNILMIFLETKPFVTSLFHALVNKTYMPAPKLETVSIIIIIVSNSINWSLPWRSILNLKTILGDRELLKNNCLLFIWGWNILMDQEVWSFFLEFQISWYDQQLVKTWTWVVGN